MKLLKKSYMFLFIALLLHISIGNALPTYTNLLNEEQDEVIAFEKEILLQNEMLNTMLDEVSISENEILHKNGILYHHKVPEVLVSTYENEILTTTPFEVSVPENETLHENEIPVTKSPEVSRNENELVHRIGSETPPKSVSSGMLFIENIGKILGIKDFLKNLGGKVLSFAECLSCKFGVSIVQHYVESGATEDEVGNIAYKICTFFKIETPRVCSGVSKLFKRELTQVLAKVALNPSEVCSFIYKGCGNASNPLHEWTVPLTPFPKPPVKPPRTPQPGSPILRVLHISDVHIDPYYQEGSSATCDEPLCCRETSGKPVNPVEAAGYWGDYRSCDIPLRTFENMLTHISKTHQIDYVIWTGDIPPHDIWNNSRKESIDLLHLATKVVHKHLGKVPIFPALGNHESSPVNSFPIPEIKGNDSTSWLYDEVAKAWSIWLPDSITTLKLGAYYSVPVYPGFRIISLNMNYCNSLNWWLLLNSTDPTGQLAWLVAQLQMAEDKGEKVHILGHIPPGEPDCLGVWSGNYYRIVNRYENTITGQFFGHTHMDEFEIFYDKTSNKSRATNVAYIGPSVTTFDGVNPGYRIYTLDGSYPNSSWAILDHETYYTNLTEANMSPEPIWTFEYSAKKDYNMTSLLPKDWDLLTHRFEEDDELFNRFYRYFYKMAEATTPHCNSICKKHRICKLRRAHSDDPLFC